MQELFEKYLSEGFEYAVASKPLTNADCYDPKFSGCTKVKIRPVLIKNRLAYQMTRTVGQKEIHENLESREAAQLLCFIAGKPFGKL